MFYLVLAGIPLLLVLLYVRIVPRNAVVVDGDTIKVRGISWRLTGFDAPEWNQPGGRSATAFLRCIVRRERAIAVVRSKDHYGRPLATILTLRGPLSWRMALRGHAWGEGKVAVFLMGFAWALRRGFWADRGRHPIVHPRDWRAGTRPHMPGDGPGLMTASKASARRPRRRARNANREDGSAVALCPTRRSMNADCITRSDGEWSSRSSDYS